MSGKAYSYDYDPIGNRKTHAIATGGPTVYTTNTVNQYESTAVPRETLQYDPDGNVTRMGVIPADIDENFYVDSNDFDHFSSCLNTSPVPPPCHDADLNHDSLVNATDFDMFYECYATGGLPPACPSPTAPANYTWDAENRLIAVTPISPLASSKKLTFAYDHMSRRIRKQVYSWSSGTWNLVTDTRFVYDDWNVVLVLNASGAAQKRYAWGLDLSGQAGNATSSGIHGAGGIGGLLAAVETGGEDDYVYWYLYDGNGNVGQVLDATDTENIITAALYEYDPYGNLIVSDGYYAADNPFRFSTKWYDDEFDNENGLYYYGYRYYSPWLGRWINPDPIGYKGGYNLYAYVSNQSVSGIDTHGLFFILLPILVGPDVNIPHPDHPEAKLGGQTQLIDTSYGISLVSDSCKPDEVKARYDFLAVTVLVWVISEDLIPHEMEHVRIFNTMHDKLYGDLNSLAKGCMCPKKASCYLNVARQYVKLRSSEAQRDNMKYDCKEYGSKFPWACDKKDMKMIENLIENEKYTVQLDLSKCDRISQ